MRPHIMGGGVGAKGWSLFFVLIFLLATDLEFSAYAGIAGVAQDPLHFSGQKTRWDRRRDIVELWGRANVRKFGESLQADYIHLDFNRRILTAKGHCIYTTEDTVIHGDRMSFHIDNSVGSVEGGTITNGKFRLEGERINKLGPKQYQLHRGEYTTCRDCPESWSLEAENIRFELGGYAHLTNVYMKFKGAPTAWFPYLIVPLKTQRESGFLFPTISISERYGFAYIQPYFWAIHRSADMTFSFGGYTNYGWRGEWEGRYALSKKSIASANFFYTRDLRYSAKLQSETDQSAARFRSDGQPIVNRWSLNIGQSHELPYSVMERLHFSEVSDSYYPIDLAAPARGDIKADGEPVLTSKLGLYRPDDFFYTDVEFRRFRNLLYFLTTPVPSGEPPNPLNDYYSDRSPEKFDPTTVQLYPRAEVITADTFIGRTSLATGVRVQVSNFTRSAPSYDDLPNDGAETPTSLPLGQFDPGKDPVRKGVRTIVVPKVYTTLRPWDVMSVVPKLELHGANYQFPSSTIPAFNSAWLLGQAEISWKHNRVYQTMDPLYPKMKHSIEPNLRYSIIPLMTDPKQKHPFPQQIAYGEELGMGSGFAFDTEDTVPLGTTNNFRNYFTPLGHSITYGVTNKFVLRQGSLWSGEARYKKFLEVQANQTFSIRDFNEGKVPLTRLETLTKFEWAEFGSQVEYFYYPYLEKLFPEEVKNNPDDWVPHQVAASAAYTWASERRQEMLRFTRQVKAKYSYRRLGDYGHALGGSVTYSINDYLMPTAGANFDFVRGEFESINAQVLFQSPSRCWTLNVQFVVNPSSERTPWDYTILPTFNFTGEGFSSFEQFTGQFTK